jgi:hypothetical protein
MVASHGAHEVVQLFKIIVVVREQYPALEYGMHECTASFLPATPIWMGRRTSCPARLRNCTSRPEVLSSSKYNFIGF